ncbi:winged helix-turn-helix transcriptional regulator [Prosthecobacter vanneervenii]|uniref:Tetratricopeptide (TPR) repeat protein n=1 Tax=Prosthecobacter vanneervenii TaxID=48466 RepID=A0A7W8DN56_9BACT|nr:MarR family transcriptional regulator [Prosthecobacter vanneervenii]MBB5035541.1 tetratricopeptide (TPR) repeat protein [Prosthecobacter vanneervenii]
MSTSPPVIPSSSIEPGTLWVFTPSRTDPAHLESILVQRQGLLQDAVDRVVDSATTGSKHYQLFVGPRGCGKSHLVSLIVSRLGKDERVHDRLRIAWLNEDETSTTLLDLLLKIHAALEARYPAEFQEAQLAEAYELKPAQALDFVSARLLAALGSHTLLVVTENLDALLTSLGDSGQKQLRAFIQENACVCFVATAQRLVDAMTHRDNPFHGFFHTEHLKPLNVSEATELLKNIATLHGKQDVVEFLSTSRGRSRVQALHHLSGGNHRIYIVLSQFITRETMDSLLVPFMKMVDELTPYYQERLRWLPAQQRKIIEHLCRAEGTVPVKEIAKRLFATPQTISSQLQDLREMGYVTANQRGRESLYEISEPLMRICVEVKETSNHEPLRLLVDFLRVWYDDKDLDERLGAADSASESRAYFEAAISKNKKEGNLRVKLLLANLGIKELEKMTDEMRAKVTANLPESSLVAFKCLTDGDEQGCLECLAEAISEAGTPELRARMLTARGVVFKQVGKNAEALRDFEAAIDIQKVEMKELATAHMERGLIKAHNGHLAEAINDYTFAITHADASSNLKCMTLFNRGCAYTALRDLKRAIMDYTEVINHKEASIEQVTKSLCQRGLNYFNLKYFHKAIADFTLVLKKSKSNKALNISTLSMRGVVHANMGKYQNAIDDFTAVINSDDADKDEIARAKHNRGIAYFSLKNLKKAFIDFDNIVENLDYSVETRADTYLVLATVHLSEGQKKQAFKMLEQGLALNSTCSSVCREYVYDLIGVVFSVGLNPTGRKDTISLLLELFDKHQTLPFLGEAVVQHMGRVFQEGAPFPSTDNLEGWAAAWEKAGESVPDFRLSLRLLRTIVNFVKAGGQDRTILLDLAAPERAIVEQALGLSAEPG